MTSTTWKLRGYAVERLLGRGGSGDVWQGRVAATGEAVALKRLPVRDPAQLRRAHAEAALLSVLDHPHLVRLHALVPDHGVAVLVLDLADGGSLADLLAVRGRLTPGEVITAVAPVAAALSYAHTQGVVHGDVSAANVLFTAGGVSLLADLGVARLTGDDADAESTPCYVDPSVAVGCMPGTQSDVFMLAGVTLHALTGAPTWPGNSADEALAAARAGAPLDVSDRLAAAGVPAEMARVVLRGLSPEGHLRGTAADFALDLRHSDRPVAVELAAGRSRGSLAAPTVVPTGVANDVLAGAPPGGSRRVGGRHAAQTMSGTSQPVLSWRRDGGGLRTSASISELVAPAGPGAAGPGFRAPGAPPPTRAVGPRPRPVIPRPRQRRIDRRAVAGLGALVVAAAVAVVVAWPVWGQSARSPSAGSGTSAGRSFAVARTQPARRSPTPVASPPGLAALAALDAVRARAFAERDPRLLGSVYAPGALLAADTALLVRLVPAGCRLLGVRTEYTGGRSRTRPDGTELVVSARLRPSTLTCRGRPARSAPGVGPATLLVVLRRTATGPRIVELRRQ
ncbi:MAG TPA: protein kinase [Jatrophihabitans sp.]|jgi:hypothetical protein|uniref:serine/threonine-protein kinase n=1 Tax=Jatrophihabitans sp. TaxID=1932789 RepID=UPI002E05AE43|nr:protein kinase [Jatrophihabitans sp.]